MPFRRRGGTKVCFPSAWLRCRVITIDSEGLRVRMCVVRGGGMRDEDT